MKREEKQKAIDALKISAPVRAMTQEEFNDYIQTINQIMDWLEQELCEDAVSRQEVLDCQHFIYDETGEELEVILAENVLNLPSVTPQQKMGHWIFDEILDKHYYCSECKSMGVDYWDYCPNCGAKMESEDKE